MASIGVLVIHGMGAQRPGFSQPLKQEVSGRLGADAARVRWDEIYWADVLETPENALWKAMQMAVEPDGSPIPLDWRSIRQFVIHNFGDALAYHRDVNQAAVYGKIHRRVSDVIARLFKTLNDPAAPIVVMAHSLGAHIMSNYLWDQQHTDPEKDRNVPVSPHPGPGKVTYTPVTRLVAMITFGCNIPIFSLDFALPRPIGVPGRDVTKPALVAASRWINFVDRDDVLGWPLRPLFAGHVAQLTAEQKATFDRIEDHEINVGSFVTAWNPVAHNGYWTDNDFTVPVAKYLRALLRALDA